MSAIDDLKKKKDWTKIEYVIMGSCYSMPQLAEEAAQELAMLKERDTLQVVLIAKLRSGLTKATQMVALAVGSNEHGWRKEATSTLQVYLMDHLENLEAKKRDSS